MTSAWHQCDISMASLEQGTDNGPTVRNIRHKHQLWDVKWVLELIKTGSGWIVFPPPISHESEYMYVCYVVILHWLNELQWYVSCVCHAWWMISYMSSSKHLRLVATSGPVWQLFRTLHRVCSNHFLSYHDWVTQIHWGMAAVYVYCSLITIKRQPCHMHYRCGLRAVHHVPQVSITLQNHGPWLDQVKLIKTKCTWSKWQQQRFLH